MRLDFSSVTSKVSGIAGGLISEVCSAFKDFSDRYPDKGLPKDFFEKDPGDDPAIVINKFISNFRSHSKSGEWLYFIVDEYDHFINEVLSKDREAFRDLTSTEEGHSGLVKLFYTCLKRYRGPEKDKPIARIFMTGVSAISLNSMTSGFNIGKNISANPRFNAMAGFTHDELSQIIDETVDFSALGGITKDQVMEALEQRCGGYRFSDQAEEEIFCPGACLEFLSDLLSDGEIPKALKDLNSDIKTRKLNDILRVTEPAAAEEICDKIFRRKSIASGEPVSFSLDSRHMKTFGRSQALSQLFCRGYLTREPERPDSNGLDVWYRAPNEACYQTFVEYEAERVGFSRARGLDLSGVSERGDLTPLIDEFARRIARLNPSAQSAFNERSLQTVFFYTAMDGNDNALQPELQCDTGDGEHADLFIKNRTEGGRQYLLALKYLSGAAGTDAAVASKLEEAKAQLERCRKAPRFKDMQNLECRAIVFVDAEPKAVEKLP